MMKSRRSDQLRASQPTTSHQSVYANVCVCEFGAVSLNFPHPFECRVLNDYSSPTYIPHIHTFYSETSLYLYGVVGSRFAVPAALATGAKICLISALTLGTVPRRDPVGALNPRVRTLVCAHLSLTFRPPFQPAFPHAMVPFSLCQDGPTMLHASSPQTWNHSYHRSHFGSRYAYVRCYSLSFFAWHD